MYGNKLQADVGIGYAHAVNQAAVPQQTVTDTLIQGLQIVLNKAQSHSERTQLIRERLFGAYPGVENESKARPDNNGQLGRINDLMEAIQATLNYTSEHLDHIERLA